MVNSFSGEYSSLTVKSNWGVDDVLAVAKANGIHLSVESATQWLMNNKKAFLERMAELGNEVLDTMLANTFEKK